jgi:hypothetical protein
VSPPSILHTVTRSLPRPKHACWFAWSCHGMSVCVFIPPVNCCIASDLRHAERSQALDYRQVPKKFQCHLSGSNQHALHPGMLHRSAHREEILDLANAYPVIHALHPRMLHRSSHHREAIGPGHAYLPSYLIRIAAHGQTVNHLPFGRPNSSSLTGSTFDVSMARFEGRRIAWTTCSYENAALKAPDCQKRARCRPTFWPLNGSMRFSNAASTMAASSSNNPEPLKLHSRNSARRNVRSPSSSRQRIAERCQGPTSSQWKTWTEVRDIVGGYEYPAEARWTDRPSPLDEPSFCTRTR